LYAEAYLRKERKMVNVAKEDPHAITTGDITEKKRALQPSTAP
jgi:hypothetical protein